jgi:TatA/E family protein of Tat protein translocase
LLSPADMLIIGAAALLFFGPDQLPKVAKRAGQAMREVQNTSQAFIREMERAAEEPERKAEDPPATVNPAAQPVMTAQAEPAPRDSYEI